MGQRDHAVVVGGSVAGLLAARVLADHYETVTVLERDHPTTEPGASRRAVPQGRHIHALLGRGKLILDDLLPGMVEDLAASGVPVRDFGTSCHWYFNGAKMKPVEAGIFCVAAGRPRLESAIRERVAALDNVRLRHRIEVTGLAQGSRSVTGVHTHDLETGAQESIDADLVVDASGRAAAARRWLIELGYPEPDVDVVRMDLSYTTCDFEGPLTFDPIGDEIALIPAATPGSPRGAIFARLADRYAVSLTGILGDPAPHTHAEFLEYVRSLPVPEIYEAVADARPLGPPATFHFPESRRIRYDRMKTFPAGLVILGDAFSAFNPVYGQGMTAAAMAVEHLRDHLREYEVPDPARFHRRLARIVSAPWDMAAGADLAYAGVTGRRTLVSRLANAYVARIQARAVHDGILARQFLRVAGLVDPPTALFKPTIVLRALLGRSRSSAETAAHVPSFVPRAEAISRPPD